MKKSELNRVASSTAIIRFQDCDPFGHLNNARYLDYFINAREDHLAACYGLDIYEWQRRNNTNWVIAKTQIAYLSPSVYREQVGICTRLLSYSHRGLGMEGVMTGTDEKDLKAVVWIEFRHFHLAKKRPADHCESLMGLFEKMVFPLHVPQGFDTRVRHITESWPKGAPAYGRDEQVAV